MPYIVEIENLSYTYPNGVKALNNITMKVKEGDCVAIIGPNGAGKTTLLLNMVGILRGAGKVKLYGLDVKKSFDKIRNYVGFVFQNPDDQLFTWTIYDEVSLSLRSLKMSEDEIRRRVKEVLDILGLSGYESRNTLSLSFGEKKKVALASVLVLKPKLLIIDEPTLGLDPDSRDEIVKIIKKLNIDYGITVIFTTHDIDVIPEIANYVYVLSSGELIAEGTPDNILTNENVLKRAGLRVPTVTKLFMELRNRGLRIEKLPLTINDALELLEELLFK